MHRGYVKSWRKKMDSQVWRMPPMYMRVFDWIIHNVNHTVSVVPSPKGAIEVKPGQRVTSLRQIAEGVSYFEYGVERVPNTKTIKAILEWLEGNGKLTVESNAKGTVITLVNWDTYNVESGKEVTQKEQPKVTESLHGLDTNKNEKNEKKKQVKDMGEPKRFTPPTVDEVADYCKQRKNGVDPQHFCDHYQTRNWIPKGYTRQMSDWKSAVRTWEKNNKAPQGGITDDFKRRFLEGD